MSNEADERVRAWRQRIFDESTKGGGLPVGDVEIRTGDKQVLFKNARITDIRYTDAPPVYCTCSYEDSEEMTRHAPLCAITKAGGNW